VAGVKAIVCFKASEIVSIVLRKKKREKEGINEQ